MVFLAENSVYIPTKDLLSWIFDDIPYDQDTKIYIDANDPSRSISPKQARLIIRKLVAGFHAAGLEKGDCVCLHSFNDIYYSMIFLGIIAAGGIFTGTNPSYTSHELIHHIKTSEAKFLITEPKMLTNILASAKECDIQSSNIWIFDVLEQVIPDGFKSFNELMKHGEEDWIRFDDEKVSRETTAARLFSSGTTGPPKAAVLSHYNLVAQHTLVYEQARRPYTLRRVVALPMFHAACVPSVHTSALKAGHVSIVMRRFELNPFLHHVKAHQTNELMLVPPIAIALIMSGLAGDKLKTIKHAAIGAAPMGKEAQEKLKQLCAPGATATQVFGMTETSCICTMFHYWEDDNTGSVGRMLPNIDAKIIDDEGNDITAYDVRGELCVRGPTIISGYYKNQPANQLSFDSSQFFKTGDIAYCSHPSKKWYIISRKKELIKVRGFQVAPAEIESVLLSHPLIIDAAVIGIKGSDADGEMPRAYVVRRHGEEGSRLEEKDVKGWCGERLARYKELNGGVRFVETIPKNASGKILKRILEEQAEREMKMARL
ncbi:6a52cfbf-8984-433f-9ed1-2d116ac6e905 [Sclerotinia trifoliorum]|uniref:6a52cfbf-8984-433f-9ed1-2d116ac6e905 n=1 Tax=Sclerotinia trifoliorum TaxID=28548 RepID=A0A8H2VNL0_9HELO|nr:6a52cfbf-8984-433f-9ed1-2d116ac6e905 [Sclerotinia trifoliorum]